MAVISTLTTFTPIHAFNTNQPFSFTHFNHLLSLKSISTRTRPRRTIISLASGGGDPLGEFGARDPFPAEIETNFCDRVGVFDTEHKILIPNVAALSLASQECVPIDDGPPMSEDDAKSLLRKVVGWRLVNENGSLKLQCLWKLRDSECAVELINRITKAVGSTSHFPNLHLEQSDSNQVRAELWTSSIGGLSMNDFIVAAKIDDVKTSDLVPRKRAWA